MDFLPKKLDEYVCNHTQEENLVLAELNRETWAKILIPRMLSGHLQGRALSMFSKMIKPKYILEIGTYTGYSAICLCEGLQEGGKLHTIDINEELKLISSKYFKKAGISKNIIQHVGDALKIIPNISDNFNLVFIDADKENYSKYFEIVIDKIQIGGFIIADNVLWSGKVIEEVNDKDQETKAIKEFNKLIQSSERVENILLPIRDGLMICQKIK
ncbi:MAG: methyltransferase [Flavobacteriales bacterium]|nr:methyltransferase [Flavobacteriales bacterium]|tara:strand:- start:10 stop:654 length:645 start_codon:yes stop_codon:yes gene_type:complete